MPAGENSEQAEHFQSETRREAARTRDYPYIFSSERNRGNKKKLTEEETDNNYGFNYATLTMGRLRGCIGNMQDVGCKLVCS